jgi:poly(beta-D-mannuronate) lyase
MYMHYVIAIALILLTSIAQVDARTVDTRKRLLRAIKNAEAGDTIVIKDGVYTNWGKVIIPSSADGSEDEPITLRAETPGKVVFRGQEALRLVVRAAFWHIEDLIWEKQTSFEPWGAPGGGGTGVKGIWNIDGAQDVVFSGNTIRDVKGAGVLIPILELRSNRVTRRIAFRKNVFSNIEFTGGGSGIIRVPGVEGGGFARDIEIRGNSFLRRTCSNREGVCNTITFGNSVNSAVYDSGLVIEGNRFEFDTASSHGEDVLHIKGRKVVLKGNYFNSVGTLTFRQGERHIIARNTFRNPYTKRQPVQLRIFDSHHQVFNNLFYTTTGSTRAFAIGKQAPDRNNDNKLDYPGANDITIIGNTFDGFHDSAISFQDAKGTHDGPTTVFPTNITFRNNAVIQHKGTMFDAPDCENRFMSVGNNLRHGNANPGCMSTGTDNLKAAPKFMSGEYVPSSESPLVNAGFMMETIQEARRDLSGCRRDESPDIGAIEFRHGAIEFRHRCQDER